MNQIAENFFCSKRELNCVARQSMEYIEIYKSDCNLSTNINSVQSKIISTRPSIICNNYINIYIKAHIHLETLLDFRIPMVYLFIEQQWPRI